MNTLAFVNQKGGCGKTTTAVNLAGALAARGERVLLVDLDPQAHATLALSLAVEPGEISLSDVMLRGAPIRRAVQSAPGGIQVLPATRELGEFEEVARRVVHPEQVLREGLAELAPDFDYAIVDCGPRADSVLTANALRAAGVVVLVVETGAFALQGALEARSILAEISEDLEDTFELRAVATLFDRRLRLAREILVATQARFGSLLFDTVIQHSVRLREAAAGGVPVQVLDPHSRAARDFESLADEVRMLARDRVLAPGRRASDRSARAGSAPAQVPIHSR